MIFEQRNRILGELELPADGSFHLDPVRFGKLRQSDIKRVSGGLDY
jgi:hypothetical protein